MKSVATAVAALAITLGHILFFPSGCHAWQKSSFCRSSAFHGAVLEWTQPTSWIPTAGDVTKSIITMRKQKASDKRTRRRQSGQDVESFSSSVATITASPMKGNTWNTKYIGAMGTAMANSSPTTTTTRVSLEQAAKGRQRSRKRSALYNALAFYHNTFVEQLTYEYKAEEEEVLGRIKASLDDPLGLETAGHALFDLFPERRGNLFADEVYRLTKAKDATTTYPRSSLEDDEEPKESAGNTQHGRYLPPNHKFSSNDVILLTLQPSGSGDFFSINTLPTSEAAVSIEARVLNTGPTYIDVSVSPGAFQAAFGAPSNDYTVTTTSSAYKCRLRADRFFSNIPYQRMVSALAGITSLPERNADRKLRQDDDKTDSLEIELDEVLREAVLQTYAFQSHNNAVLRDPDLCDVQELANLLAKPPMVTSPRLAHQVLKYIRSNPQGIFREFNVPQRIAIEAALTRRLTMIHGPPGSGKTTVAAAIAFGFAHQCRSLPSGAKVLACAFSNVGADNLAEALKMKLGLNVVRIGKASAVSESLWNCTLDAAIDRDPAAQKALQRAAVVTAELTKLRSRKTKGSASSNISERFLQDAATSAVKASIKACNIAATKALREADIIVSTSTGAADPRLLAACGLITSDDELTDVQGGKSTTNRGPKTTDRPSSEARENAPDGLPPLSLPFVIIDEACQSLEPASLIPIVSTNSCRSLVLLGDPCQLPPTVRSQQASGLSISLMERLAAVLPPPSVSTAGDSTTTMNTYYLDSSAVKQAKSLLRARASSSNQEPEHSSYRKRFSGSVLLSVQYRMHPSIAAFPSAIFYNGLLSTPAFMSSERRFPSLLASAMPCADSELAVRFINVGGRCNERQGMPSRFSRTVFGSIPRSSLSLEDQTTYWNEPEAERVVALIRDIVGDSNREVKSLGVVTPYNGQVQLIKSMIASDAELRRLLLGNPVTIEVKSVDGYQGRERDIIIFSAVRSNRQGRIGFLQDWRRMNVALTRGKCGLLVIGDLETLAEADMHWDAFAKWGAGVRCIYDDYDSPDDEPSH